MFLLSGMTRLEEDKSFPGVGGFMLWGMGDGECELNLVCQSCFLFFRACFYFQFFAC